MRKLLDEFWYSWHTWIFFGCLCLILMGFGTILVYAQRNDYQRKLDASASRTVADIRRELEVVKLENALSLRDRQVIHRDVAEVKQDVAEVKRGSARSPETKRPASD